MSDNRYRDGNYDGRYRHERPKQPPFDQSLGYPLPEQFSSSPVGQQAIRNPVFLPITIGTGQRVFITPHSYRFNSQDREDDPFDRPVRSEKKKKPPPSFSQTENIVKPPHIKPVFMREVAIDTSDLPQTSAGVPHPVITAATGSGQAPQVKPLPRSEPDEQVTR